MKEKWIRPVLGTNALTNGYSPHYGRVLAKCGSGPYPTLVVLEDGIQNQFGLAMITFAHLPEPAHAGMVVDLGGEVPVRLIERYSASRTAVHGVDHAWRGRPIVA